LTEIQVARRLTKKREELLARLPPGTRERIDAVLGSAEKRADFLRKAVERELQRREFARAGSSKATPADVKKTPPAGN
jgi:hypothetical protein